MSHSVALHGVSADISAHNGLEQTYAFLVGKNRSCRRLAVRFHSKRHDVASGRVENVGVRKHVVANFTGVQKPAGIGSEFPDPCDVMTHQSGCSIEGAGPVSNSAPLSVMSMMSSMRMPNSPGI